MKYKIITDSSADMLSFDRLPFASVPLKIITNEKEYKDTAELDTDQMIADLQKYKGASHSSCPNAEDWLSEFGDYDGIFCVTITSGLSGSCNSANVAANEYISRFPDRKVFVIDTLSTGPENALIIEKLAELISQGCEFEEITSKICEYKATTHLIFCLESLRNLANNGRVNSAVAKISGVLGIRIIGAASNEGTLAITDKSRGSERTIKTIFNNMLNNGYSGGKVRIHHCQNLSAAQAVADIIKKNFNDAEIIIDKTGALCSFYAESGGLLVGFEGKEK